MMPSQGFIAGSFRTSIIATTRSIPAATIETARIPVFLLTGFLGSGKTTLLNAALRAPALAHTAVVVNELGEIGLDLPGFDIDAGKIDCVVVYKVDRLSRSLMDFARMMEIYSKEMPAGPKTRG